ncbi:MAG: 2'-deoxycytidine 5'-triphosphate deaminase domain-containing protein, partial [Methylocystis sp.]
MNAPAAPIEDRANSPLAATAGGVLSSRQIQAMADAGQIRLAAPLAHGQIQPASLDLRLGPKAYRVRASFLPGKRRSVDELLSALKYDEMSLEGDGAVLERGCFYVVPLLESLRLGDAVLGAAN